MRRTLAAIVMLGLPALAAAQSAMPAPAALPPIGLPLPPIGLPLPTIGLPPLAEPRIDNGQPSRDAQNQFPRFGPRRGRLEPTVIYLVPTYGWGYPQLMQTATPAANVWNPSSTNRPPTGSIDRQPAAAPTGRLRLEVQADGVRQLFVDSYYVGTLDDVDGELELEAGAHKIEIRAAGYETVVFDVKIAPYRSITYKGALKPVPKPEPDATVRLDTPGVISPVVTPAPSTTLYFIPGCYLGNVPPENVALPATCDLSRLVVHKPEG